MVPNPPGEIKCSGQVCGGETVFQTRLLAENGFGVWRVWVRDGKRREKGLSTPQVMRESRPARTEGIGGYPFEKYSTMLSK